MNDSLDLSLYEVDVTYETDEKMLARLLAMVNVIMDRMIENDEECRRSDSEYRRGKHAGYMDSLDWFCDRFVLYDRFHNYIHGFMDEKTRILQPVGYSGKEIEKQEDSEVEWQLCRAASDIEECFEDEKGCYKGRGDEYAKGKAAGYLESLQIIKNHFGEMEGLREFFSQMPQLPSE